MRLFPLRRGVDGNTWRTHLLFPVSTPDRLHPHWKRLNGLLGGLKGVVIAGEGVLQEADLDGVAPLVLGEPSRQGFGLFQEALVVGAEIPFEVSVLRSSSLQAELAPGGGRRQRRKRWGGAGAGIESVWASEGGKGVAPARPPSATLTG